MTKNEANKLIHEKIMGECAHRFHDDGILSLGSSKCLDCGTYYKMAFGVPNYCEDANEAVKVWNHMSPRYSIDGDQLGEFWKVYKRVIGCIAESDNFCTATAQAALHSLGITEEIEG